MANLSAFYSRPAGLARLVLAPLLLMAGMAWAEEQTRVVQPGDVLSKIVAEAYPANPSQHPAIMAKILRRNPGAFLNQDPNRLQVGKTLILPDPASMMGLAQPAAPLDGAAAQERIRALEGEVAGLRENVALLEEEKASLQAMLKNKQVVEAEKKALQAQLEQAAAQNKALENDLQQLRASVALAESKRATANRLPWILLALLALLTLPLLWLLRRKQQGQAANAALKAAPAAVPAAPAVGAVPELDAVEAEQPSQPDDPDMALKLDIARAYLDLRDAEAAADILQDVLAEGSTRQRQEAREILSFLT